MQGWQDAINYAAFTRRTIYPVDGLYMLDGPRGAYHGILTIPTGADITIAGSGQGCRLKLPDGYSHSGDYRMMVSADRKPMGKVEISGLLFDGNGQNNLVKDSKANLRSGYAIFLFAGNSADLHDLWFENIAGRSAVVLADNGAVPGWGAVRMSNNHVRNAGGAIRGNEAQNDHSSFYVEARSAQVSGNDFSNDDEEFDPQSVPQRACTAMEIHCVEATVSNNTTDNFGTAGMAAAVNFDVATQIWQNNKFLRCKANAFATCTMTRMERLVIAGNQIQVDNRRSAGGCGIFQNPSTVGTRNPIQQLQITDNVIASMRTTPSKYTTHGALLCAFGSLSFLRNQLSYWQGDGLRIQSQEGSLAVSNAVIDQCQFHNCGIQLGATNPFAIYILNRDPKRKFSRITIGPGNRIWQDKMQPGAAPLTGRGIRISGPGPFEDVVVHMPTTTNIAPDQRMSVISAKREGIQLF